MLNDMNESGVLAPYREYNQPLFQYGVRHLLVNDTEVPYPDGKLIVSRTDTLALSRTAISRLWRCRATRKLS